MKANGAGFSTGFAALRSADDSALIAHASEILGRGRSGEVEYGQVSAALRTTAGTLYRGVCIDAPCGVGFCAEHAAIAAMVSGGELQIVAAVAVHESGRILAPCGRCREFMALVHAQNRAAWILLPHGRERLEVLLPHHWVDGKPRVAPEAEAEASRER